MCLPWSSKDPGFSLTEGQRLVATGWGKITNDRREVLKVSCPKSIQESLHTKNTVGEADCGEIDGVFF